MSNQEQAIFQRTRRVEFADTDMAGIVHFTNMLKYMEETEYAFLRSLGLSVSMSDQRGRYGFPRLNVQCDYLRPAQFEDELTVSLRVSGNDGKQLHYEFEVDRNETQIARGKFCVACCRFPLDGGPFAIPIPESVLEKIPLT